MIGFGSPGERITRRDTVQETFVRISQSVWFCIKYSIILTLIIPIDMLVIGWLWGGALGGEALIILSMAISMIHARRAKSYPWKLAIMVVFVIIASLWPIIAEKWLPTWWPLAYPPHKPYPHNPWSDWASWWILDKLYRFFSTIPGWIRVLYFLPSTIAKAILGWSVWASWVEMIDPSGPSAPRKAMDWEGVWYPWYGRWYEDETVDPQVIAKQVRVEYVDPHKGFVWNDDIPYEAKWIDYCRALGNGDPFSEPEANKYGITGAAYTKVRDLLMEEGKLSPPWVVWRDEKSHNQGLEVTEQGRQAFAGVGRVEKPEG